MSKSAIYAVNRYDQTTTTTESIVNFDSVVRKFGCSLDLSGGNVIVSGYGYYNVDTNLVWTAGGTTVTVQLYDDGVAVPGTDITMIVTAGQSYSITIPAIVRRSCNCESALTVGVTGPGIINNASMRVVKL